MTVIPTHRRRARILSAMLLALLMTAAAACTGSDEDATDVSTDDTTETSETTEVTTETTEANGTTETSDTTSTATSETTVTTASTTTSSTAGGAAGAPVPEGSGCTPGDDETLPDGRWFGYASSREADSFSFDLACWFTGDDAALAASEDGAESPPPNDYHIRNDNTTDRLLIPAPDATVEFLAEPGDPSTVETIDYPSWVSLAPDRSFEPGVWVDVKEGLVVAIEEQYQP